MTGRGVLLLAGVYALVGTLVPWSWKNGELVKGSGNVAGLRRCGAVVVAELVNGSSMLKCPALGRVGRFTGTRYRVPPGCDTPE